MIMIFLPEKRKFLNSKQWLTRTQPIHKQMLANLERHFFHARGWEINSLVKLGVGENSV